MVLGVAEFEFIVMLLSKVELCGVSWQLPTLDFGDMVELLNTFELCDVRSQSTILDLMEFLNSVELCDVRSQSTVLDFGELTPTLGFDELSLLRSHE